MGVANTTPAARRPGGDRITLYYLARTLFELAGRPAEAELALADSLGGLGAFSGDGIAGFHRHRGVGTVPTAVTCVRTTQHFGAVRSPPATGTFAFTIDELTMTSARSVDLAPFSDPTVFAKTLVFQADTVTGTVLVAILFTAVETAVPGVTDTLTLGVTLAMAGTLVGTLDSTVAGSKAGQAVTNPVIVAWEVGWRAVTVSRTVVGAGDTVGKHSLHVGLAEQIGTVISTVPVVTVALGSFDTGLFADPVRGTVIFASRKTAVRSPEAVRTDTAERTASLLTRALIRSVTVSLTASFDVAELARKVSFALANIRTDGLFDDLAIEAVRVTDGFKVHHMHFVVAFRSRAATEDGQ